MTHQFTYQFLKWISPIIIVVIAINYIGDPAQLFYSYEEEMAEYILNGDFVTNISDFKERKFQEHIIQNIDTTPETIIIGSSRGMLINSSHFPSSKFFNHCVSSATLEDLIAIVEMYNSYQEFPKNIIIEIPPYLLYESNDRKRWKEIEKHYWKYNDSETPYRLPYQYYNLISPSYFQSSLKNIIPALQAINEPIPIKIEHNLTNTILSDGSINYGDNYESISHDKIKLIQRLKNFSNFNQLSTPKLNEFKTWIKYLLQNKIEVSFFFTPINPVTYEKIETDYPMIISSEKVIKEIALDHGINVIGQYSPKTLQLNSEDFYDGFHCKKEVIDKIIKGNNGL